MTSGEVIITAYITLVSMGLGTLLWARLNRIEDRLDRVEEILATKADKADTVTKADLAKLEARMAIKADVANCATKADLLELRRELREDLAHLRSDLTQVALAVGARPPHASEG